MSPDSDQIEAVRRFSRFYTRQIDLLNEGLLASPFSLSEARVLFELAHRDVVSASELTRDLGIDAGYLSRILKRFEQEGWLARRTGADARRAELSLTPAGRDAFAPLDRASHDQVAALLDRMAPADRAALAGAMARVEELMGPRERDDPPFGLRAYRIGDLGWIARRQGVLYAQEYGWDASFEALVAEILASFVKSHDPARERAWIAERRGEIVGSVFTVRQSDEVAKLRLLYVEPDARGLGIGRALVQACTAFCRDAGYRTLTLWTNDILTAARRIYLEAGFTLVEEERHRSFGQDLVGQNWSLTL